ncbi:acyl-CoA dehydrogenase family protein [Chromobacterium subtsugae]|uniref:Acyl-CoA dehydrogenase family protein n=1 Tax=Chromobacterium subtsugae TaxID=251747 RepID=A0ABS7FI98_9NEIS|nr:MULTISPECIES: acyl-CoA dehydrogenase family protein [Chromobacterium]KUM02949.1 acyl-CoA dehydrogenase [Chromobacterium subtsugae]KZE84164.1 acyl-CoA dehydrogenase [Chromobacterium sp. F49]MBW7569118.1 acyl-CoA dehydrogenase family protein [Chromobacterium subtsugae]MBW8289804.1 acyl-CoA dehydrogenase family protein [Chromobacterium subtsugae]OBU85983.1 acyl-CoA dehydrogenase [Chromobacterium subtsugae]
MLERFLSPSQNAWLREFERFAAVEVAPYADDWDLREATPAAVVRKLAENGWLGGLAAKESGGLGFDATTFGLLNMAIGAGSGSLTGLLNVHSMVLKTLETWGSPEQKQRFLAPLVKGEIIGAFAQTEVSAGGDSRNLSTRFDERGDELIVSGQKSWITFAQIADLFLVFGKYQGLDTAVLVPKDTPGLTVTAKKNMLGFKSAYLAVLDFDGCRIPKTNIVGKPGFGQSLISTGALDYGRISVAWAALGIQQAALAASARRAGSRSTFGTLLADQGIIRAYLAEMSGSLLASQLICLSATQAKEAREEDALEQILQAKLFASKEAGDAAAKAVQIHGGHGCDESSGVSRLYRDAKILQVVEGSNELQKMLIGKEVCNRYGHGALQPAS